MPGFGSANEQPKPQSQHRTKQWSSDGNPASLTHVTIYTPHHDQHGGNDGDRPPDVGYELRMPDLLQSGKDTEEQQPNADDREQDLNRDESEAGQG